MGRNKIYLSTNQLKEVLNCQVLQVLLGGQLVDSPSLHTCRLNCKAADHPGRQPASLTTMDPKIHAAVVPILKAEFIKLEQLNTVSDIFYLACTVCIKS